MKKRYPTLLASTIWMALYSQTALASLAEQCKFGIPIYERPLVTGDTSLLPVNIQSDDSQVNYPASAVFTGNVAIEQGSRLLIADRAEVNQILIDGQELQVRTVTATGNIKYDDNMIKLNGPKAWTNLNTKDTDVYQGNYQMVGRQGRGDADKMKLRENNRYAILDNGAFTSCLPGDSSWSIVGSEIIHDNEEQLAEIWNARFKIGSVPVFYSPYLQIPTGNKRRSGFLIPSTSYGNNNGFEFSLPYYWNIAPNFDATLTPHYINERGMLYQNEFRYLLTPGAGTMAFDGLKNDRFYKEDMTKSNKAIDNTDRWLFYWNHSGVMSQFWRFNIDYTKVSDSTYLSDINSPYGSSTDGYATQKYSVGYASQNWDATISMKQFQIFNDTGNANAYRTEPQIDMNNYQYNLRGVDLHTYGQLAKFSSENPSNPMATRAHLEPTLSYPIANNWGSIDSEVKLMATHYQQDFSNNFYSYYESRGITPSELKESVNRVLPQYKMSGKVVFDRPMDIWQDYTQTLEPRVQYLYVPYKDQSDIYIYDSTLLQTDYTGLFRDRTYGGLDRIASANQVTTGLTTRVYDDRQDERFNASIGQIYFFENSRTGDNNRNFDDNKNNGSVVWAGDSFWRIDPNFALRGGIQYDTRLDNFAVGNAVVEYRKDRERVAQISYRYASKEYVSAMSTNIVNGRVAYDQDISQIGGIATWPIVDRLSVVGSYYYDTKLNQSSDSLIGFQYNTCCWAIGVGYERKIIGWNNTGNLHSDYDNKVSFNIELRGLSNNYNLGGSKMMRTGILPYQRAF